MDDVKADIRAALEANMAIRIARDESRYISGYSDASYKATKPYKGGGWGIRIRDDNWRITRAGPCPDWVMNSNHVELCGVWAAIYTACTKLNSKLANIVVIKTDNQAVCHWFGWKFDGKYRYPKHPKAAALVQRALELCAEHKVKLVVTWVKGHNGTKTIEGYLNNEVDRLAGKARISRKNHSQVEKV